MRTLTITTIFIITILATISAQFRYDISPVLPGDHPTNFDRIYNGKTYIPTETQAVSTDTDRIIWIGLNKITDDESSAWEKKVIVTKIVAKKTELIFTSRRAERLYNETILSPDISEKKKKNFKLLVVLVAKRGQKINKETVKELSQHI